MKKQTAIALVSILALTAVTTVSAQTVQGDVSADAAINTGGGLGKGINYMVRSILGDTGSDTDSSAPQQRAPRVPAPQTMMMQVRTDAQSTAVPGAESKAAAFERSALTASSSLTEDQLHAYIEALLRADSRIQSIETSDSHVRIAYAVPARVFGVVPVMLRLTAGAYVSGGVELSYPWFSFAASGFSADIKTHMSDAIEPLIPSQSFTVEEQQTLIDALLAELRAEFDASTTVTR